MKTARTILPLLFATLALMLQSRTALGQLDTVYISNPKSISGGPGGIDWQLSFKHTGPDLRPIGNITLTLDTNLYPYVRFDPDAMALDTPAITQYQWSPGSSDNDDKIWWCNSTYQIGHGVKDSLFIFGLMANPNTPNVNIYDSVITIQWASYFQSNDCTTLKPSASGNFQVVAEPWQNYKPLDTVTATSTVLANCDPQFTFTVQNRNPIGKVAPIDHLIFQLLPYATASMRPADVQAPSGWTVQSVTQTAAYFAANSTNSAIAGGASVSGFKVGLRAQPVAPDNAYGVPFVWSAYNGGSIIDRDTMLDTAASLRVAPCNANANTTPDTLVATNDLDCNFDFDLANVHSGEGPTAVSRVTALRLEITSPKSVTWSTATAPTSGWFFTPFPVTGSPVLAFHAEDSSQNGIAGGNTLAFPASINDSNPGELVTVHWVDSSGPSAVSSGNVTIKCAGAGTPDSVFVDKESDCCYRVRVKDAHGPTTSNLHAVLLVMNSPANGSFDPNSFSSNAQWASNAGAGDTSVQFTATNGSGLLAGATDTFYFCTMPAKSGTPWGLTVITREAKTNNIVTDDTIKNIAGCTPPVILDSVIHRMDANDCRDTIEIINHNTSPIDTVQVIPQTAGVTIVADSITAPWPKPVISGDTVIISGREITTAPQYFTVTYSGDVPNTPFSVRVRTIHRPTPVSEIDTMLTCTQSGAVNASAAVPLELSIAPNPLRNQTNITLTTGATSRVNMVLLNVLGETAKVVEASVLPTGEYHYTLDASTLAAGTYYLRLEADGQVVTKKLVIER